MARTTVGGSSRGPAASDGMRYGVGIDLGTTYTAAAVASARGAEICTLGVRAASIPSVVFLREDGDLLVGEAAERRALVEPERAAVNFKRRLGDPTPLLLGDAPFSADALSATVLASVVAQVAEQNGGPPERIVVTHPASYGEYKLDMLRQAVRQADLGAVGFVSEPEAAAIHYAASERIAPGDVVATYDFGGGTFDAAILRRHEDGFEVIGQPEGLERLGGIDLDHAILQHVLRSLGPEAAELDPHDPAVAHALARLRDECRAAKELLSVDADVTIPVALPSVSTGVLLTRAEFEAMVRPRIAGTLDALGRAVRAAGLGYDDLRSVLLVGGTSRIPVIREMVREATGRPVVVDAHPKHSVALGAAAVAASAIGRDQASPAAAPVVPTPAAVPVAPAPHAPPVAPAPAPSVAPASVAAVSEPTVSEPTVSVPSWSPSGVAGASGAQGASVGSPTLDAIPSATDAVEGASRGRRSVVALAVGIVAVLAVVVAVVLSGGGGGGSGDGGTDEVATGVSTTPGATAAPEATPTTRVGAAPVAGSDATVLRSGVASAELFTTTLPRSVRYGSLDFSVQRVVAQRVAPADYLLRRAPTASGPAHLYVDGAATSLVDVVPISFTSLVPTLVLRDGRQIAGSFVSLETVVPPGGVVPTVAAFRLDAEVSTSGAVLRLADPGESPANLPLDGAAPPTTPDPMVDLAQTVPVPDDAGNVVEWNFGEATVGLDAGYDDPGFAAGQRAAERRASEGLRFLTIPLSLVASTCTCAGMVVRDAMLTVVADGVAFSPANGFTARLAPSTSEDVVVSFELPATARRVEIVVTTAAGRRSFNAVLP